MKLSKVLGAVTVFGSNFYLASTVLASEATDYLSGITAGTGETDLLVWLRSGINLAIGLAALICVGILIASGYSYITASGDETKIEKATKSLTYAIVGLVICFISVILVQFVLTKVIK